eukprot:GHVU01192632.1.p1 GENE.GHVU01192632.1~~GHVU01192632.1.p1  ORF type:complete len:293 (-),score=43.80 GHVU01192632.1:313-1092(-)
MSYVFTYGVNGFTTGFIYRVYKAPGIKRAVFMSAVFLPLTAVLVLVSIGGMGLLYRNTMALNLWAAAKVAQFFFLLCLPLQVAGAAAGRFVAHGIAPPCRVHQLRRPIPRKNPLLRPGLILLSGLVNFGAVFIEIHFLLNSFFGHRFFYVYTVIGSVLGLFCVVVVCTAISGTYLLLNSEDYRWPWSSVYSGASTAVYVLLYSAHYFLSYTKMKGPFQVTFFFAGAAFFSLSVGLVAACLSFLGSSMFVHAIYKNIKSD